MVGRVLRIALVWLAALAAASGFPAPATVSETVPETVPETVSATASETASATVPEIELLPGALAEVNLSGGAAVTDEQGQTRYPRGKVAVNTLFFVLGISFAFMGLALGMTAIGKFFSAHQMLFARIGGVILILIGIYIFAKAFIPALQ